MLVLAGCASTYAKPGASEEERRIAEAQCRNEARGYALAAMAAVYSDCMIGKGWVPTK